MHLAYALPPPPTETEAPCPGELNNPSCSLLPRDVEYGPKRAPQSSPGEEQGLETPSFLSIGNGNPSGPGQRDAALYRWSWETSAHHVVAVHAVGGVLHGVVHLSPERRQVLRKPREKAEQRVRAGGCPFLLCFALHEAATRTTDSLGSVSALSYGLSTPRDGLGSLARTDLSLFLVRRLRSMPSMRFSKQRCIACCFSGGWLFTILFLKSEKYWGRQGKDGLIFR